MGASPFPAIAAALAAGSLLVTPRPAQACGGCFTPPQQVTDVTDHRMAFSISQQQTVLWDQIKYSGQPQDFAWVLPVQPGAQVQLSHDEFFAALDALSDPVIAAPPSNCGRSGSGCAFGGTTSASGDFAGAAGPGVQVVSQSVIGPYDTATLHATDPDALYDWLVANDYDIPDGIRPVIDAYVAGGFDFIALRLAPGQGVQAMQPVRVVSAGAGLTLPLRMVAAGVGDQVGLTLYVIGEGRYEAQNFPNAVFDDSKLQWLHAQNISNYEPLAEQIMQGDSGRTWLTEFSETTSLVGGPTCSSGTFYGGVSYGQSLASLYYAQCLCDAGAPPLDAGPGQPSDAAVLDAQGLDAALFDAPLPDAPPPDASPPDASPPDASGTDAEQEASVDDAGFSPAEAGASATAQTSCTAFDDLDVALTGMDPASTWVTRMRAIFPASALSEGDLVLQATAVQTPVSNQHQAAFYDDPTYSPCGANGGGGGCSATRDERSGVGPWLVVGSLAFLGLALGRRRRRST
jgi:Uncharacterized protein conserved in bacteria (DUF2330)